MHNTLPVPLDSLVHVLLLDNQSHDGRTLEVILNRTRDPRFTVERLSRLPPAVQRLGRNTPAIDVVVTELTLTDTRGMDLLQGLREAAPDTALVVLVNTPQEARAVAAEDCLSKGHYDRFTLGRILAYAVERRRLLNRIAELEDRSYSDASLPQEDDTIPLLTLVLDHEALAADWRSLGGEAIREMVALFHTATQDTLKRTLNAARERNSADVAKAAHLLASAAASLHLQALAQTSRQVEQSCLNGQIPTLLIRQLSDLYRRSVEALNRDLALNSVE